MTGRVRTGTIAALLLAAGLAAGPWPAGRAPGAAAKEGEAGAQEGGVGEAGAPKAGAGEAAEGERAEVLQGRVRWLSDVVQQRYGVRLVPEAAERLLVLETSGGQIVPILEDVRGRAFRRDERLRDRDVELLVRRREQLPMVQVVKVFALQEDGAYEVDYWCEVCAISMVEKGPCDCCQQPNQLRLRKRERRQGLNRATFRAASP